MSPAGVAPQSHNGVVARNPPPFSSAGVFAKPPPPDHSPPPPTPPKSEAAATSGKLEANQILQEARASGLRPPEDDHLGRAEDLVEALRVRCAAVSDGWALALRLAGAANDATVSPRRFKVAVKDVLAVDASEAEVAAVFTCAGRGTRGALRWRDLLELVSPLEESPLSPAGLHSPAPSSLESSEATSKDETVATALAMFREQCREGWQVEDGESDLLWLGRFEADLRSTYGETLSLPQLRNFVRSGLALDEAKMSQRDLRALSTFLERLDQDPGGQVSIRTLCGLLRDSPGDELNGEGEPSEAKKWQRQKIPEHQQGDAGFKYAPDRAEAHVTSTPRVGGEAEDSTPQRTTPRRIGVRSAWNRTERGKEQGMIDNRRTKNKMRSPGEDDNEDDGEAPSCAQS